MTGRKLPLLLTMPSAVIFIATFVVPFAYFFVISFWIVDYFEIIPTVTLANYREMAQKYVSVSVYTVWLSTVTALITVGVLRFSHLWDLAGLFFLTMQVGAVVVE